MKKMNSGKVGKCLQQRMKKKPPSLRRHYPDQVLRVLSQLPHHLVDQHPGNLKTGFPPVIQR
jgi:hypothetical protein